jgi:hypothetical protein
MEHLLQTTLDDRQVPGDPHRLIASSWPGAYERTILHPAKLLHAHIAELQCNPNGVQCLHRFTSPSGRITVVSTAAREFLYGRTGAKSGPASGILSRLGGGGKRTGTAHCDGDSRSQHRDIAAGAEIPSIACMDTQPRRSMIVKSLKNGAIVSRSKERRCCRSR